MELLKTRFQPKLPARIAGIVFWVLVLISLVGAFYFLDKIENETTSDRNKSSYLLAHELEGVIEQAADVNKVKEILTKRLDYFHEESRIRGGLSICATVTSLPVLQLGQRDMSFPVSLNIIS